MNKRSEETTVRPRGESRRSSAAGSTGDGKRKVSIADARKYSVSDARRQSLGGARKYSAGDRRRQSLRGSRRFSKAQSKNDEVLDFDEIYRHAGECGKFQLSRYVFLWLGVAFAIMQILQLSFTAATPAHRCKTVCDKNKSEEYKPSWIRGAIPYEDGAPSKCNMYKQPNCDYAHGDIPTESVECDEWVYDDTYYTETAITDYSIVCGRSFLAPLTSSILMAGELFGSIIFGTISDKIGRKKTWCLAALSTGVVSVLKAVIPSLAVHIIFACLCSICAIAVHVLTHVICMEIIGKKYRIAAAVFNQVAFASGETLLGVVARYVRKWRNLQFLIGLPFFILAPLMYWILPESPRWLALNGRWEESREIVIKIAKANGNEVPENLLPNKINTAQNSEKPDTSLMLILRRPKLRNITFVILFNWFVNAMLFYGMSFNTSNVEGIDPYVIYYITMLAEIPGDLISLALVNRIGRKKLFTLFYLIIAVACFISGGIYEVTHWGSVAVSLVGKACVAGNFGLGFIYTGELYPTFIRGSAVGAASMSARPGGIVAPYIAYLGDIKLIIPLCIFGGFAFAAAVLTFFFLPETLGRPLPETLEEAECFKHHERTPEDPAPKPQI